MSTNQNAMQQDLTRSYHAPVSCGPWGITLDDTLRTQSRLNASFDQRSWEDAKLDGCLPRVCNPLPSWPPQNFIYPSGDGNKKPQELLDLGVATGCPATYALESPYVQGGNYTPQAQSPSRAAPPATNNMILGGMDNPNQCAPLMNADMAARVASKILGTAPPAPQAPPSQPQMVCAPIPPSVAPRGVAGTLKKSPCAPQNLIPCTINSVKGAVYDLSHWNALPGNTFVEKMNYVVGRDNRPIFIIIGLIVAIFVLWLLIKKLSK